MNRRAWASTAARIARVASGASSTLRDARRAIRSDCGSRSITSSSMYSRRCLSSAAGSSSIGMQSTSRNSRTFRSSSWVAHSAACCTHHSGDTGVGSAASDRSKRLRPICCVRTSICSRSAGDNRLGTTPSNAAPEVLAIGSVSSLQVFVRKAFAKRSPVAGGAENGPQSSRRATMRPAAEGMVALAFNFCFPHT
jgi:hypothetical protein